MAGLLGWPLDTTFSPAIHNAAFTELGLPWVYCAFRVPPEGLAQAVKGARQLGFAGLNVTIPHKEPVAGLVDEVAGEARTTGAVNTIAFSEGRMIGLNTDVEGFMKFLSLDVGISVEGRQTLVLGAGGAARAVARGLGLMGAARVAVAARDEAKAAEVAKLSFPARGTVHQWIEGPWLARDAHLVVNATPVSADAGELLRSDVGAGQHVVDLSYLPESPELVLRARAAGADAFSGLGMLVHQAAASFEIWTGRPAPIEVMSAAATAAAAAAARTRR